MIDIIVLFENVSNASNHALYCTLLFFPLEHGSELDE